MTRIVAMKPEIIELASVPPATAGLIVRQARELGYKGLFVKNSAGAAKETVEVAGKEGAEGVISQQAADFDNPGYKQLADQYRKSIGQEPNEFIVAFYDSLNVMLHAMQKAGTVDDTGKVSAAFGQALPMKSILGDELTQGGKDGGRGDPNQIMNYSYISIIKDGQAVVISKAK
jgi:branched-chain amino acid transport system substrate-binding protein